MSYAIYYTPQTEKERKAIPATMRRPIRRAIEALATEPRPAGAKQLRPPDDRFHRMWVGKWRVIYEIDDAEQSIQIHRIWLKTGPETYENLG